MRYRVRHWYEPKHGSPNPLRHSIAEQQVGKYFDRCEAGSECAKPTRLNDCLIDIHVLCYMFYFQLYMRDKENVA